MVKTAIIAGVLLVYLMMFACAKAAGRADQHSREMSHCTKGE